MSSYKLGTLSKALGIRFNSAAHRAEADAEVAAQLLVHIGHHLTSAYGIAAIDPALLISVNNLAAAKVPHFLQKQGLAGAFVRAIAA